MTRQAKLLSISVNEEGDSVDGGNRVEHKTLPEVWLECVAVNKEVCDGVDKEQTNQIQGISYLEYIYIYI